MADEPTTHLADNLRTAASLVERIGWQRGATWSGTSDLGLHAADELELSALVQQLDHLGLTADSEPETHHTSTATFTAQDWHGTDGHFAGLTVVAYSPRTRTAAA